MSFALILFGEGLLHVAELGLAEAEKLLGFLGFLFVQRYRERLCLFEFADNLFNAFDGVVVRKIRCFHTLYNYIKFGVNPTKTPILLAFAVEDDADGVEKDFGIQTE